MPGSTGNLATLRTPAGARTPATATPVIAGIKPTAGRPTTTGMLAIAGSPTIVGTPFTSEMTVAAMSTAAGLPESVRMSATVETSKMEQRHWMLDASARNAEIVCKLSAKNLQKRQ
jgi:hypothetical protein